jgi:hypothetical protein
MPIDARIPLGVTGPDPNGFTNALAAGMKMRELRNASDRQAYKDGAAQLEANALAEYGRSPRGQEDLDRVWAKAPGKAMTIEKSGREAALADIQAKKAKFEWAKANHDVLARGAAMVLANPTRKTAEMVLDNIETEYGGDMTVARQQLATAPDESIPTLAKGWGMNAQQIETLALAEAKAKAPPKPRYNTYTGQLVPPPAAGAGPEARSTGGQGSPNLTGTEDPTFRYFKNRHGLSDTGAFALSRNITQESGHRPDVKGDGGKAQGLAQWHPDRWAKLEQWAQEQGLDPTSKQAQMDYIIEEGKSYPGYESLKGNDPEAIRGFIKNFEGYGVEGARFAGLDARATQDGGVQPLPPDMPAPSALPVEGEPPPVGDQAPMDAPPPQATPPRVYGSPAERDAARDAAAAANAREAQRFAREAQDRGFAHAEKMAQDARAAKAAAAEAKRSQPTPQIAAKNREKFQTLDVIDAQLQKVEDAFVGARNPDGTRKPGIENTYSAGLGGGYLPTEGGRAFDATVDGLRPFLRQLSRTPGEGAMSDYETKQAEALLPSRNDHESVTKQKILQLRDIAKQIRSGMAVPVAPASVPEAIAQTDQPLPKPAQEFNAMPMPGEYAGKRIRTPDGTVYRSDGRQWVRE